MLENLLENGGHYASYCTVYKANITHTASIITKTDGNSAERVEEVRRKSIDYTSASGSACFGSLFRELDSCERELKKDTGIYSNITIYVTSGFKAATLKNRNNVCLLHKYQIERHLSEAQKLFPFNFSVSRKFQRYSDDNFWTHEINIKITSRALIQKYLLTWVRYLYEMPYSKVLPDVYRAIDTVDYFKNIPAQSLMLVAQGTFYAVDGLHCIQAGVNSGPLYTIQELRDRINDLTSRNQRTVNDIYNGQLNYPAKNRPKQLLIDTVDKKADEAEFKKRADYYKSVFELNK